MKCERRLLISNPDGFIYKLREEEKIGRSVLTILFNSSNFPEKN